MAKVSKKILSGVAACALLAGTLTACTAAETFDPCPLDDSVVSALSGEEVTGGFTADIPELADNYEGLSNPLCVYQFSLTPGDSTVRRIEFESLDASDGAAWADDFFAAAESQSDGLEVRLEWGEHAWISSEHARFETEDRYWGVYVEPADVAIGSTPPDVRPIVEALVSEVIRVSEAASE